MKKVFLDTNIILDILDAKRLNHIKAKELLQSLILSDIQIVISEDMLSTIYYICKDKKAVLEFFEVIYEEWDILCFGKSVVLEAIEISKKENNDFEDTLQCICAKNSGCDAIYTNDKRFVECGIDIVSLF
jgi:predicted nucleic acid-binding protein